MRFRLFALVSAFTVLFSSVAYAAATPSNVFPASYSDAIKADEQVGSDKLNPVLLGDGGSSMSDADPIAYINTINYSDVEIRFDYYDMSSVLHSVTVKPDSSGHFSFALPSDFTRFYQAVFILGSDSLPRSGVYQMGFSFTADTGGYTWDEVYVSASKGNLNAADSSLFNTVSDYSQFSGDLSFYTTIDIGYSLGYIAVYLRGDGLVPPWGGILNVRFVSDPSASPALDTPGTNVSSEDMVADNTADIANNTSQIAQGQVDIQDTIREQIQYIIMQIESFWNQLAGEFTKMFAAWDEDHQEQLANDNKNTQDIIDNLGDNTSDIINNNNQNTQTIVDGWNGSDLEQSGNDLNDSLTQYDDIESGIHDTASGWLDGYTLPDFDQLLSVPGVIASCTWLGTFMQSVFVGMGAFNIPVTLSLVLIFVLILVGYYRIRR